MAIYVTGDTHGGQDKGRLWQRWGSVRKSLTREDVLIIAGDCGAFWVEDITAEFRYWLLELGCTVLFIDGNHDDHMKLLSLQSRELYGADVGVAGEHLFHLRRGRIYRIGGLSVFCFGGGQSVDRARRKPYVDWWEEEVPSREEFERAVDSLISADGR